MNLFGELERQLVRLYPHRVPLALVVLALAVAAAAFATRRGWTCAVWRAVVRHRIRSAAVAAAIAVLAVPLGLYLLSPLWAGSTLVEESPLAAATAAPGSAPAAPGTPATSATPGTFTPRSVLRGEWQGADDFHFARGQALVVETAPGRYVLRVEQFAVRNGPDLFVYLSPDAGGYADRAVNLGGLKATEGAFNYEIPAGITLDQLRSAVVWCRQFAVQFGHAPLHP